MGRDDKVYKIAIAGYFHDIGKFAERAHIQEESSSIGFFPSKEFMLQYEKEYLPYYQGRYTHIHALYTAAFIDHIEKLLPSEFNKSNWAAEIKDSFIDLAAGHHKPKTPMQWIIAMADRVSSAFERKKFEDYNNEINVRDYRLTRLSPIFEEIALNKTEKQQAENYQFFYPLKDINAISIFPKKKEEYKAAEKEISKEYQELFFDFVSKLEKLKHKDNLPLWFEHFDSLFMIYGSMIPASTVGWTIPNVSLYDHSKMTSALSTAIYLYHLKNDSFTEDKIKDYEEKKFLLISGDFTGIQNFIFSEGGSTNAYAAKLLRGRSFEVSLISELTAYWICDSLNLTLSSIILNAAGHFTILAPNLPEVKEKINFISQQANDWLIKNFFAESTINISYVEASYNSFINNYDDMIEEIEHQSQLKKCQRIDMDKYGGVIEDYLDRFNNELNKKLCPFCGKRPSSPEVENDKILGDEKSSCKICRDQIFIGKNLVKHNRIAVVEKEADLVSEKLKEALLGKYQILFFSKEQEKEIIFNLIKKGKIIKYWDISIPSEELSKDIGIKLINGYVAKYSQEDIASKEKYAAEGQKQEEIQEGDIKTFNHLAKEALTYNEKENIYEGISALGIIKADIDNLGLLLSKGIKNKNLSKMAALSRQIDLFFSLYIPYTLKTKREYKNIYSVFSGGDDLFLIGPWNSIISFAEFINSEFQKYFCYNQNISLSAGIIVCKPGEPVSSFAERAEEALKLAKSAINKNSICLFQCPVDWKKFDELQKCKEKLMEWLEKRYLNNAMLFKLNDFSIMAKIEKEIIDRKLSINKKTLEALKWPALFKYHLVRNAAAGFEKEERNRILKELEQVSLWIKNYNELFKIALWQVIYNKRKIRRK